jgi:CRP-like cAMP-binding protein
MKLSTIQKQACLKSCPLFAGMEPGTLNVLAEALETEVYSREEEICVHGEEADRVYVIAEGSLAVFLPGADSSIRHMVQGDIFGEYGMFTGARTTTITADVETTLLSMEYSRFKSFLFQYPDAMYELLSVTVDRLGKAEARLRAK